MIQFISWLLEDEQRPEFWDDLYSEYISLRENKSANFVLSLVKDITYLKAKYNIVTTCCDMLNVCFQNVLIEPAEILKDTLRRYNFRYPFDLKDPVAFSANIRAVLSANKKTITTWQRKEKELEIYQEKHKGKPWDRKAFYMWAIAIGEKRQARVDLETVCVAEWCLMMNDYEKYCEVMNAQNNKVKPYGKPKQN